MSTLTTEEIETILSDAEMDVDATEECLTAIETLENSYADICAAVYILGHFGVHNFNLARLQKHAYEKGEIEVREYIAQESARAEAELEYLFKILEKHFGEKEE